MSALPGGTLTVLHTEIEASTSLTVYLAKSLGLRTAMSPSCLWQHQGKRALAHELLALV